MTKEIENAIEGMAKNSLRTIGILFKELSEKPDLSESSKDENGIFYFEKDGFTMLGICGIKDVIRPEVPGSIKTCNFAGI